MFVQIETLAHSVKLMRPVEGRQPTPKELAALIGEAMESFTATWRKDIVDDLYGELILSLVPDLRDVDRRDKHIIQSIKGMAKRLIDEQ